MKRPLHVTYTNKRGIKSWSRLGVATNSSAFYFYSGSHSRLWPGHIHVIFQIPSTLHNKNLHKELEILVGNGQTMPTMCLTSPSWPHLGEICRNDKWDELKGVSGSIFTCQGTNAVQGKHTPKFFQFKSDALSICAYVCERAISIKYFPVQKLPGCVLWRDGTELNESVLKNKVCQSWKCESKPWKSTSFQTTPKGP